jgi:hypothetical protein
MRVPMTIADFLDRAELGFASSPGVIDEPNQPAPPVPASTYGRLGECRAAGRGFESGVTRSGTLLRHARGFGHCLCFG